MLSSSLTLTEYVACTKQPQGAVEIDYGDSITRGLLSSMVASLDTDVVRKTRLTSRSGKPEPTQLGMASPTSTSQGFSASSENIAVNRLFDEITLVAVVVGQLSANPTSSTFTHCGGHETAIVQTGYAINGISAKAYYHPTYTGTFALNSPVNTLLANGQMQVIVFRYRRNGLCELFVNNVVVASGTSANNAVKFDHPFGLGFNQITKGSGLSAAAGTLANAIYGRALTDAEIASISSNPWQLFRQKVSVPLDVTVKENRKPVIRESNLLGTSKRKLSDVNVLKGESVEKVLSKQPQQATGVNWSNPLSSGLVFGYSAAADYDFLGRIPVGVTSNGSGPRNPGIVGIGKLQDTNRAARFLPLPNITSSPNVTIAVLFQRTGAVGQWARLFDTKQGSQGMTVFLNSAGTGQNVIRCTANAAAAGHDLSATLTDSSKPTLVVFTVADASARIYEGNIQIASSASGGGTLQQNSANSILFGSESSSSIVSPFNGLTYMLCVWNRTLSAIEVANLSANPWQLFKNQSQLILPK